MMLKQVNISWTNETILDFLRDHRELLHELGVTKIGVFGSYARGDQYDDSDVDILFSMDDMTFTRWMDLWNFLEDNLGREIDLVPEKDLRPELRRRVLDEVQYVDVHLPVLKQHTTKLLQELTTNPDNDDQQKSD